MPTPRAARGPAGGACCAGLAAPESDHSFRVKLRSDMLEAVRTQQELLQNWACSWEQRSNVKLDEIVQTIRVDISKIVEVVGNGAAKTKDDIISDKVAELEAVGTLAQKSASSLDVATNNNHVVLLQTHEDSICPPTEKVVRPSLARENSMTATLSSVAMLKDRGHRTSLSSSSSKSWMPQWSSLEDVHVHEVRQVLQRSFSSKLKTKRDTLKKEKHFLTQFVDSVSFKTVTGVMVFLNTFYIGVEVNLDMDYASQVPEKPLPRWCTTMNQLFTFFFTVELLLRMAAYRKAFWCGFDWKWNVFDAFIVGSQLIAELLATANMSALRVIRVFRIVRTLRVIRVISFFRDLRMMVCCVFNSIMSLFWAAVMLCLMMYLFSIILLQGTAWHLRTLGPPDASEPTGFGDELNNLEVREAFNQHLSSIGRTLLTLLMVVTGGVDWYDIARPLMNISWVYLVLFAMYIVFVLFGVLNVLAAVFVDHAVQITDRDLLIQMETNRMKQFIDDMSDLFCEFVTDESKMTRGELIGFLQQPHVISYMSVHSLDVTDVKNMFELLDSDRSGTVELHEFVLGTARLKGQAKCLDVMRIFQCLDSLQENVASISRDFSHLREKPMVSEHEH